MYVSMFKQFSIPLMLIPKHTQPMSLSATNGALPGAPTLMDVHQYLLGPVKILMLLVHLEKKNSTSAANACIQGAMVSPMATFVQEI